MNVMKIDQSETIVWATVAGLRPKLGESLPAIVYVGPTLRFGFPSSIHFRANFRPSNSASGSVENARVNTRGVLFCCRPSFQVTVTRGSQ